MWGIIITLTILSFVVWFSPYSRMDGGGDTGEANFGTVNGKVIKRLDYLQALREVNFRYFLNRGVWPDRDPQAKQSQFDPEREVYYRLLLTGKAKELGIEVSTDTAAQLALNIMRQAGAPSLQALEAKLLQPYLKIEDLERFAKNEIALQQLVTTVGLPGTLFTPQEAKLLYQFDSQEVSAQLAFVAASNYLSSVVVTPEALQQFFTNRAESYRVPAQVQVNYIKYEITNQWALAQQVMNGRITNFPAVYEAVYEQRGSNYFSGKALTEVTNQIHTDLHRNFALDLARTNAVGFLYELSELETLTPTNLPAMAKAKGLAVRTTSPFDNSSRGPQELNVPELFVQKAFTLTEKEPVGGPIIAEDCVYVIGLARNLASYIPTFASVSNRVRSDFLSLESNRLARQAGEAFAQSLAAGLLAGKDFAKLSRDAGFRWYPLDAFSRGSRSIPNFDLAPLGLLQEAAFKLSPGKTSEYVPLSYGGFVLYVKELLPMNDTQMQAAMPRFLASLRQNGQSEAFNSWFRKQAETGLRDTPLNRSTPPTMSSGPRAPRPAPQSK